MSHIIALANQKGGVGKTTTAVNLAACLAAAGRKTLLVDMDPQGNATSGLGLDKNRMPRTVYDLLIDDHPDARSAVLNPLFDKLYIIPSNIQLIGAEVDLLQEGDGKERRLSRALEPIRDDYQYVIIDAPPSLGLLNINVLTAADRLIVPVQSEYYALEGLSLLMESVRRIRSAFNPNLRLLGLLITMHDARTNLAKQVEEDLRGHFGDLVFQNLICRTVKLSEAPSFGKPIILYDYRSAGAECYVRFAGEVIQRCEDAAAPASPTGEASDAANINQQGGDS